MSVFNRIYSRQQWGARHAAGFGDRSANYPLSEVWTHHTVTAHLPANATVAQEMAQMRILEDIGQSRFGKGISYSFVIFPSGRIYMGLGASRIGAHTGGRNSVSLGVAFAGNYEEHKPTAAAEAAYADLLRGFRQQGIIRQARTNGGHKDAPGHQWNACCGRHLMPRLGAINSRAANAAPAPVAVAPAPAPKPSPAKPAPAKPPKRPEGELSMSDIKQILEAIDKAAAEIRNIPQRTWQHKDHQNAGHDYDVSKSRQLGLAAERAISANSRANRAAQDAAAVKAMLEALAEHQDDTKEELIAAVRQAALDGAASATAADVADQLEVRAKKED